MKQPPKTNKIVTKEKIHGRIVQDDYRWLEDVKSKEVQKWIEEQNTYANSVFKNNTDIKQWQDNIERYFRLEHRGLPVRRGDKLFYQCRGENDDLPKVILENIVTGEKRTLIDVSKLSKDGTASLGFWVVSRSGKFIAYSYDIGGSEISSLHVLDVETGEDLIDTIPHVGHGGVNWLDDDSGFFYIKMPTLGEVRENELRLHAKIQLHMLGAGIESDKRIFGDGLPEDNMYGLHRAKGARYLAISVSREWTKNDVYLYDLQSDITKPFICGKDAHFSTVSTEQGFFVITNYKSPNEKLLFIPCDKLDNPLSDKNIIIPEKETKLCWFSIAKSRIITGYTKDAVEYAEIYDYNGNLSGRIPTPEVAGIEVRTSIDRDEIYYSIDTPERPRTTYEFNAVTSQRKLYFQTQMFHDPSEYETKKEWVTGKDGTRMPVYITKRKDTKTPLPTILYGYGGFNSPVDPAHYLGGYMAWLEAGGAFATAVIRGGGEYGEKWHKAGIKKNKQNSFDDFIATAECLIKSGYTSAKKLAIFGASNGGLLVGATMAQRPDLFKAVVSGVPLLDMIHFHKLLIAGRWVHEYGDPEKKEEFNSLIKWSPYHNIDPTKKYPALLLTTAENDTRVHPMHALKMAALLQNVNHPSVTLLHVEKDAGHTSASTVSKHIASLAERLAFLGWQLNLRFKHNE